MHLFLCVCISNTTLCYVLGLNFFQPLFTGTRDSAIYINMHKSLPGLKHFHYQPFCFISVYIQSTAEYSFGTWYFRLVTSVFIQEYLALYISQC